MSSEPMTSQPPASDPPALKPATHSPDASKPWQSRQSDHGHGGKHSPALVHQFDDLKQQHDCDEFGMWLFLATEILFFGGLFMAYALYRLKDEATFTLCSHQLDLWLGTFNTMVLLTSSLTMALAVHAAEAGNKKKLIWMLVATMAFGIAFLGIKAIEYTAKYEHHLMPFPGLIFELHGAPADVQPQAKMYFVLYFLMTGLHGLHMVIGFGIMTWLLAKAFRGGLLGDFAAPVHITGLYWHFVDIVWVFLFPLFYLIGFHTK